MVLRCLFPVVLHFTLVDPLSKQDYRKEVVLVSATGKKLVREDVGMYDVGAVGQVILFCGIPCSTLGGFLV